MRPLWWLREQYAKGQVLNKPQVALESNNLSCETSGGLPCAHSMTFTVFILILASFFFVHCWQRYVYWRSSLWRFFLYPLIVGVVVCMWLSRLYLATEFLHQCVLGSYFGIRALNCFEGNIKYLYSRRRRNAVIVVTILGGIAVGVYFLKLRLSIDPHWSVREVSVYWLLKIPSISCDVHPGIQMVPRSHVHASRGKSNIRTYTRFGKPNGSGFGVPPFEAVTILFSLWCTIFY